jgi:hypothetical protein
MTNWTMLKKTQMKRKTCSNRYTHLEVGGMNAVHWPMVDMRGVTSRANLGCLHIIINTSNY